MSNMNYINDLFKALDFPESFSHSFVPVPYEGTDSCFRNGIDRYGRSSRFMRLRSVDRDLFVCPHCDAVAHHESKGIRKISLTHISCCHQRFILEIEYRKYFCHHCRHYFRDDIPVRFKGMRMTTTAAQACLVQFRENTAMAVISRMMGISRSSVYRMFFHHISVPERFYHIRPVISIDEFRATTDRGTYAFHITDPVSGEPLTSSKTEKPAA